MWQGEIQYMRHLIAHLNLNPPFIFFPPKQDSGTSCLYACILS